MILIINGPNLNMLGVRDPEIYGQTTLADIEMMLCEKYREITFEFYQSNSEGSIIDFIQARAHADGCEGIVINPGAYSHYSYAIADALRDCPVPVVEVHLSNIHTREEFRHTSVTAQAATAIIAGMGPAGYAYAVQFLHSAIGNG